MKQFHNLLVGIDVDAAGLLAPGSAPAVQQALQLAARHAARLTFAHAIDQPEAVRNVQELQPQSALSRRRQQVGALLEELAAAARAQGLDAQTRVLPGPDWRALIELVQQQHHDLVLVGTRARSVAGRALFGSTGNRLLRYCPCPVWCVKGDAATSLRSVLVAHDLSDAGRAALQIGAAVAEQQQAALHVLHVLELPEDRRFLASVSTGELQLREQAAQDALQRELDLCGGSVPATCSVLTGSAHAHILDYLRQHPVDLLCMGSVARSGLQGLLTGNTAEQVLPWLACSLITVKPQGFVTPVGNHGSVVPAAQISGRKA